MKDTKLAELIAAVRAVTPILEAPTNRFGKPEYFDCREACEATRQLALKYNVGPSHTTAEQAGKVLRAALKAVS